MATRAQWEEADMPLVVVEGLDRVGKTTVIQGLLERYDGAGYPVAAYREPGGTALAEEARRWLKGSPSRDHMTELLLFLVARRDLLLNRVLPDLAAGYLVLLDRFEPSTLAYQVGGNGLDELTVKRLMLTVTPPVKVDLILWLDLTWDALAARPLLGDDHYDQAGRDFFNRVRQAYLRQYDEDRCLFPQATPWRRLDASASPYAVLERCAREVRPLLQAKRRG